MRACNPAANASASDAEPQDSTKRICRQVEPADSCRTRPSQSPRLRARAAKTGTAAARSKLGSEPKAPACAAQNCTFRPAALCCTVLRRAALSLSPRLSHSRPKQPPKKGVVHASVPPSLLLVALSALVGEQLEPRHHLKQVNVHALTTAADTSTFTTTITHPLDRHSS